MADSEEDPRSLGLIKSNSNAQNISMTERMLSGAGAAVFSAIIFNPLDVVKTRLQAQVGQKTPAVRSDRYKGAFDAFCKIIRQEGLYRPGRGTSAALTLVVPTVGLFNTI
jgi:hypothetical protein